MPKITNLSSQKPDLVGMYETEVCQLRRMNGKLGATVAVLLCLISILAPFSFAKTSKGVVNKPNGWILHQVSDEYGVLRTELTHDAMRLQTEDMTVIIKGPTYDICIANAETRKYLLTNIRDFAGRYKPQSPMQAATRVVTGLTREISGVTAIEHIGKRKAASNEVHFWTTTDFGTTKDLNDTCIDYFCLTEMPPGCGGFLLQSINYGANGSRYIYLDTKRAERAYITPSRFDYPSKFEKVDDFVALQEKGVIKKKVTTDDEETKLLFQNPDDSPPGVDKSVKTKMKQPLKKHQ